MLVTLTWSKCFRRNKSNIDFGFLTETKIRHDMYTRHSARYNVVLTSASSNHQGNIALFSCPPSADCAWHLEGTKPYGPNVMGTFLISRMKRWLVVGVYTPH